jgi:excisionase family DNA binding protein
LALHHATRYPVAQQEKATKRNGMKYSLSEAAKATGKNKTTIQRAIKSGKISASKGDGGSYEIDPSELHRVFPPTVAHRDAQHMQSNDTQQAKFAPESSHIDRVVELEKELAVARERANGLEAQKDQMTDTINDLRKRLDSSESRVTALLTDNKPKRSLLSRLFR